MQSSTSIYHSLKKHFPCSYIAHQNFYFVSRGITLYRIDMFSFVNCSQFFNTCLGPGMLD